MSFAVGDTLVLTAYGGDLRTVQMTKSIRVVAQPGTSYGTGPTAPPAATTLVIGALAANTDIQVPDSMPAPPGGQLTLTNHSPFTVDWNGAVSPATGQLRPSTDSVTLKVAPGGFVTLSPYANSKHTVRFVAP
jgi:hypothetical protein